MKTIETSGKTVEDAIKAGLKELGCDIGEVSHEVIDAGSPGLFGMFGRLARVRMTLKEADPDLEFDMPVLSIDQPAEPAGKRQKQSAQKAEKPATKPAPKPETAAKAAEPAPAAEPETNAETERASKPAKPRRQKGERPRRERKPEEAAETAETAVKSETDIEFVPAPADIRPELPPLNVETLSETGKKAYDFIANVTRLIGVDIEIRMAETENGLIVDITGDTLGVLIGRRGETMDALQYLTSLTINKDKNEYTRVSLDVEHYRAKREETLRKLALRMANRAKKSGRRVALEPMNPYERRVLHSALQNHPYVQTHSEGEEPYRRVIITLK